MELRQISQSHLTLLEHCPRKFQYIYLEQLGSSPSWQEQAALKRGSDLHHLMQQQELQLLPAMDASILQLWSPETVRLYQMAHRLAAAIPDLSDATCFRQSEYRLHHEFEDMVLTVVYDLLVLTETQAYIFDWKTYSQPPRRRDLAVHWQTRLYPFVLAASSNYLPSAITLSYWFGQPLDDQADTTTAIADWQPDHLQFDYGDRLLQQGHQLLTQTICRLKQWLADYKIGNPLPQTDQVQQRCSICPFALRCGRSPASVPNQWADLENIEAMDEVPLPGGLPSTE